MQCGFSVGCRQTAICVVRAVVLVMQTASCVMKLRTTVCRATEPLYMQAMQWLLCALII
jgi:hypothetical protein